MKCKHCGEEIPDDSNFCEFCGVKISGITNAAAVSTVAAERCSFDVILKSVGPQKLAVVKEVRESTGLGLKETKQLVESTPQTIKKGVTRKEAENLKKVFDGLGAEVEIGSSAIEGAMSVPHSRLLHLELEYLNGKKLALEHRVTIARYTAEPDIIKKIKYDKAKTVLNALLDNPNISHSERELVEKRRNVMEENIERQRQLDKEGSRGCYIATAVYGSYDCPEVWTLRRYRDYVLDNSWYGRAFIRMYYAISPTLVKWFGQTKSFKRILHKPLNTWVKKLNEQGFENTPYKDK
ncbi:MAG: ribosomal protein L7/L12 [Bacteroidales bacterium]|nr:ribosomal protein L7/L12 [Bacteroidales bacterium]